jgi:hypothetical protein
MRKISLFLVLAAASLSVAAQQQQKQQPQPQSSANAPDKELVERARADGSAGGTAPVAPERRKAVGAGAGPHLQDNLPSPQKLPKDEPVAPPK